MAYVTKATTKGGRNGRSMLDDGGLALAMAIPKEIGGAGDGHNPEQLFAVGYSACFMGAMQIVGAAQKIRLPADTAVDASVSLGRTENDTAYGLAVTLSVSLPGLDREQAQRLVDGAHQACPYSHATRGNIVVTIGLA